MFLPVFTPTGRQSSIVLILLCRWGNGDSRKPFSPIANALIPQPRDGKEVLHLQDLLGLGKHMQMLGRNGGYVRPFPECLRLQYLQDWLLYLNFKPALAQGVCWFHPSGLIGSQPCISLVWGWNHYCSKQRTKRISQCLATLDLSSVPHRLGPPTHTPHSSLYFCAFDSKTSKVRADAYFLNFASFIHRGVESGWVRARSQGWFMNVCRTREQWAVFCHPASLTPQITTGNCINLNNAWPIISDLFLVNFHILV